MRTLRVSEIVLKREGDDLRRAWMYDHAGNTFSQHTGGISGQGFRDASQRSLLPGIRWALFLLPSPSYSARTGLSLVTRPFRTASQARKRKCDRRWKEVMWAEKGGGVWEHKI